MERDTTKEAAKAVYPDADSLVKDIYDQDGDILAIVARVNGKWGYIGITTETLKKIIQLIKKEG